MSLALLALFLQDPSYDSSNLSVGTTVDQTIVRDLDGNGSEDLVVQSARDLRIFFYKNGLPANASQTIRLEPKAFLWTLARVKDKNAWCIAVMSARGIHYYPFSDGGYATSPTDLVVHPTMFEGEAGEGGPAYVEFAPDLDRDGKSDFVMFLDDEIFVLMQQADGSAKLTQKLPLPDEARMTIAWNPSMRHKEERVIPMLTFGDATGDGKADLTFYREEAVVIFEQKDPGKFTAREAMDLAEKKQKKRNQFVRFELPPMIADLNGDGIQDVVLPYPSKGKVHVYYVQPGRALTTPDDTIQTGDSWTVGVFLNDLNQDGKPDLVVGIVRKFGIFGGLQAFLSGRVDLELHVHHMRQRYEQDPDQVLTFSVPFSFSVSRTEASIDLSFRPTFESDINGDGLRDLLLSTESEVVHIWYGRKEGGFQEEAGGKIVLNAPSGTSYTHVAVGDFNKDGKSDLVLKHIHVDQQKHYVQVKMSK